MLFMYRVYLYQLPDRCNLPVESGPCDQSQERWFYNPSSATCQMFTFSGCRGNRNRFTSKQGCQATCQQTASPPIGQDIDGFDMTGILHRMWRYKYC